MSLRTFLVLGVLSALVSVPLMAAETAKTESVITMAAAATSGTTSAVISITPTQQPPWKDSQAVGGAGAFSYSYPIKLPEGTAGLQPTLSLDYSSAGSNGILGMGFRLAGMSAVERDLSYPTTFKSDDHYVLDGQKLYFNSSETTFHPEREDFSKIQAWSASAVTDDPNTALYWVVQKKDGTTYYYGDFTGRNPSTTNKATIPALGYPSTPRCWALSKVQDANGNFYTYNYRYDSTTGAYYPLEIVYTQGNGLGTFKTVQFSYETRIDHGATYQPSKVDLDRRLTWISVLMNGSLLRKYQIVYQGSQEVAAPSQINSIQEYGTSNSYPPSGFISSFQPTDTENTLPPVKFQWPASARGYPDTWDNSSLGNFTIAANSPWFTTDVNGDGKADIVAIGEPGTSKGGIVYVAINQGNGKFSGWTWMTAARMVDDGAEVKFGDVSGNGRSAFVCKQNGIIYVNFAKLDPATGQWGYPGSGNPSDANGGWDWSSTGRFTIGMSVRWALADVVGTGRMDLIALSTPGSANNGIVCVWASTGSGFSDTPSYDSTGKFSVSVTSLWFTPDLNGDGRADIVCVGPTGAANAGYVYVSINNGQGGFSGWTWNSRGRQVTDAAQLQFGNVAGDGRMALVCQQNNGVMYVNFLKIDPVTGTLGYPGTGNAADANGGWDWSSSGKFGVNMQSRWTLASVTASGRQDLVTLGPPQQGDNGWVYVFPSIISGFTSAFDYSSAGKIGIPNSCRWAMADLAGDGKQAIIGIGPTGYPDGGVVYSSCSLYQQQSISLITLPTGATIAPTYTPATQVPGTFNTANSNYPIVADSGPRSLVTSVGYHDPTSGSIDLVVDYQYTNGLRLSGTPDQRRSLGFQTVKKTVNAIQTTTTYFQENVLNGIPKSVVVQDGSGKYSSTIDIYEVTPDTPNASNFIKLKQARSFLWDKQSTPVRKRKTMNYDTAGNLIQVVDEGFLDSSFSPIDLSGTGQDPDQAKIVTNYTYDRNSNNVTRMTSKKVISYDKNHTSGTAAKTTYYYDNLGFRSIGAQGRLTQTEDVIDASHTAVTKLKYDTTGGLLVGNLTEVYDPRSNDSTETGAILGKVTKKLTYDETYQSQVKTSTDALNRTTTTNYDSFMRPTAVVDINGQSWLTSYDAFGRVVNTVAPGDTLANPTILTEYSDVVAPNVLPRWTHSKQLTGVTNGTASYLESYTFIDGLGRTIQTKKTDIGGWVVQDYYYDAAGRNDQVSVPYHVNGNPGDATFVRDTNQKKTVYTFDPLNRVTVTTHPDGTKVQVVYEQNKVTTVDENGHATQVEDDVNVVFYRTYTGPYPSISLYSTTTTTKYRGLTTVKDNTGAVATVTTFDALGRRSGYADLDMGGGVSNDPAYLPWQYTYDNAGNLKTQTDAKGQVLTFTYDALNRPVTRTNVSDPLVGATWAYDEAGHGAGTKGRLTSTTYYRGGDSYSYDARGRLSSQTRTLDGAARTESFTYDSADREVTRTLPDGEVVTSAYGDDGNLITLSGKANYLVGATYNALGKVKTLTYGNALTTNYGYYDDSTVDPNTGLAYSYRLRQILAGANNSIMNLSYTYEKNDNVHSRTDANHPTYSETYTYDELSRLTRAQSMAATLNFEYDALNNLTRKDNANYNYGTRPHAATSTGSYLYTYDANGNLIGRSDGRVTSYDAENRVVSVSDGGSYNYDTGRQRTIQTEGPKTTYYYFPDYEETKIAAASEYPNATAGTALLQDAWISDSEWTAKSGTLSVNSGLAKFQRTAGTTGFLNSPIQTINADQYKVVKIKARAVSGTSTVRFKQQVPTNIAVGSAFTLTTAWQIVTINTSNSAQWSGTVTKVGIAADSDNAFEVDWIYIGDGTTTGYTIDPKTYLRANGTTIAVHSNSQGLSYLHADHLGSASTTTDSLGGLIRTQIYQPYGTDASTSGTATTDYQFTGQEKDATGLYYYDARYYDPQLGRFIQPDPAVWDGQYYGTVPLSIEEQMNSYLYARNNPVVYTDPTGLMSGEDYAKYYTWKADNNVSDVPLVPNTTKGSSSGSRSSSPSSSSQDATAQVKSSVTLSNTLANYAAGGIDLSIAINQNNQTKDLKVYKSFNKDSLDPTVKALESASKTLQKAGGALIVADVVATGVDAGVRKDLGSGVVAGSTQAMKNGNSLMIGIMATVYAGPIVGIASGLIADWAQGQY